jgi:hypothetical protein
MNTDNNNNLNEQEIKKTAFIVYVVVLILTFIFPPVNAGSAFAGWSFISNLGYLYKINIPYLLIEMGMATVVYIFFLISQKK